jgi:hypothetical protein
MNPEREIPDVLQGSAPPHSRGDKRGATVALSRGEWRLNGDLSQGRDRFIRHLEVAIAGLL